MLLTTDNDNEITGGHRAPTALCGGHVIVFALRVPFLRLFCIVNFFCKISSYNCGTMKLSLKIKLHLTFLIHFNKSRIAILGE